MTVSRPRDSGLALTLALTGVPASLGVVCLSSVLPLIEAAYAGQPAVLPLVKYVSVGLGLGMVIGAPLAGALSDRVGRRITLIVATIGFCLFGAAGYLLDGIPVLIAQRTLAGACAAAILTMGVALMGECCAPERRDRLIGLNAMTSSLAAIATVAIAGGLGTVSVKLPFLLHLLPLPLAGLALRYVPATARAPGQPARPPAERLTARHWSTLGLALASGIAIFSIPVYLPFFMRDAGLGDPRLTATVLAAMSICAAGCAALFGWARSRLSLAAAFMTCLTVLGMGCAVLLVSVQLVAFGLAAVLLGCGSSWVAPNLMSAANLLSAAGNRGRVVGLVKGVNLSGSFLAVALLDPLYRTMGMRPTLLVIALLAASLMPLALLALRVVSRPPG